MVNSSYIRDSPGSGYLSLFEAGVESRKLKLISVVGKTGEGILDSNGKRFLHRKLGWGEIASICIFFGKMNQGILMRSDY